MNTLIPQNSVLLKRINTSYFLVILFLSFYFGKERAIFCDGSNALYDIVTKNMLYYGTNRVATVINYILPLLAVYAHASLKTIVYLLALNYVFLPVFVFLFLRFRQKSLKYETSFLIAFSFFNWQTFYYPIHDYWSGFYLIFVLYRIVDEREVFVETRWMKVAVIFLTFFILFCHINTILSLSFLAFYLFIDKKISRNDFYAYAIFIIACFFAKILLFKAGYENGFISLSNFNPAFILSIFTSDLFVSFLPTLLTTNVNFLVLTLLALMLMCYHKRWSSLFTFIVILFTSFFILMVLFKDYFYTVYAEGQFKSTTIVLAIIITNILFDLYSKKIQLAILVLINYIFSSLVLWNGGLLFKSHYQYVSSACKMFKKDVYLVSKKDICPLELIVLPRHSIIINQLENNSKNCLFGNINNEPLVDTLVNKMRQENQINPVNYFTFSDSITYLNADSMNFDMSKLNLIFQGTCMGHLNRIKQ